MSLGHKLALGIGMVGFSVGLTYCVRSLDEATALKREEAKTKLLLSSLEQTVSKETYSKIENSYSKAIDANYSTAAACGGLFLTGLLLAGYAFASDVLEKKKT